MRKIATNPVPMVSWKKKYNTQKTIFVLFAVGPAFLGYLLFTLYPNILSVYYSFIQWDGLSPSKFVGIYNFKHMIQDPFVWRALSHNLVFMITVPPLTIMISLLVSYLLTHRNYIEAPVYKVIFFLPNVLSVTVIALLWSFIYDGDFGLLNAILKVIGIDVGQFYWLGNTNTALFALIPPVVWSGVGFNVIIFMNAMSAIPKSLYEEAILNGATHLQKLFKITIPLIQNVVSITALFSVLGVFKTLDLPLIMTNGGPQGTTDFISLYMFNIAFGSYRDSGIHMYGYASAIGMFLLIILVGVKFIVDRLFPDNQVEF